MDFIRTAPEYCNLLGSFFTGDKPRAGALQYQHYYTSLVRICQKNIRAGIDKNKML